MIVLRLGRTSNVQCDGTVKERKTYVSIENTPFLKDFGFVVVIDAEAREEDLVLICRYSSRKLLLCRPGIHPPLLDECPKRTVVQVVDMA